MPQYEWQIQDSRRFTPEARNLAPECQPCFKGIFYTHEKGLHVRQIAKSEAFVYLPDHVTEPILLAIEEVFGFEYWQQKGEMPGLSQQVGFGVKTGTSGIATVYWGTKISHCLAGISLTEIGLVVLYDRKVELRVTTLDWLKDRGFRMLQ